MKNKQIVGMVVAAVLIIVVGVSGAVTNIIQDKVSQGSKMAEKKSKEQFLSFFSGEEEIETPDEPYVGQLDIVGTIQPSTGFVASGEYDHDRFMKFVDVMMDDENNKGIFLNVNSPGGTVYESDEMYLKLMEYKEKTGRPIYAYFGSYACSGAYYISMAADKIYGNRNSWIGSIGVIISYNNYNKLFKKLGVEEINITSGANKAMGSSGEELTDEQREIFQGLVDDAYEQFVGIVCEGRGMDEATVKKIADGRVYTTNQSVELKLIDSVGSVEDMKADFEKTEELGSVEYYAPEDEISSLISSLYGKAESLITKSDIQVAKELAEDPNNGVLMYYAK